MAGKTKSLDNQSIQCGHSICNLRPLPTQSSHYGQRALLTGLAFIFAVLCIRSSAAVWPFKSSTHEPATQFSSRRENLLDVKNQTFGFERVFVLGMSDRFDRKDLWTLASYFTDFNFEDVNGRRGDDGSVQASPASWDTLGSPEEVARLQGHKNIMRKIVEEQIETALVFEDDADWDITIKSQLTQLARGTRWLQGVANDTSLHSPYGDGWDFLWLGHCGVRNRAGENGRHYVIDDDPTVVPYQRQTSALKQKRPDTTTAELQGNFTRIIHEVGDGACSSGYAVSLKGAQKFLYQFSILSQAPAFDLALKALCSNQLSDSRCYAPFPGLISTYKNPVELMKELRMGGAGLEGETENIVFPMKAGLGSLIENRPLRSRWPEDTLWPEISLRYWQLPEGRGIVVTED